MSTLTAAGGLTAAWRAGVLEVVAEGRTTLGAVRAFEAHLWDAVAGGAPFAVLYDRRRVTAPTPDGRRALTRWPGELLPALGRSCRAWADVLHARRAASLRRAGYPVGEQLSPYGYRQRSFTDPAAARAWLDDVHR
ncbi:MAG: hypothetical protein ACLGIV_14965 [Actinomycetes bacterium]